MVREARRKETNILTIEDIESYGLEKTAEIAAQNARFQAMLEAHPDVLYVTDPHTYEVIATNERFKFLLNAGQTGLSCAFDLPTQMGYDSDHETASGEVGKEVAAPNWVRFE